MAMIAGGISRPASLPGRRQRGQAMVEFVIGATLFLIPVFLIVPLLGKYADMRSSVIQAARYNAWERTVWYGGASSTDGDWSQAQDKSEATIKGEMAAKFLTNELWFDRSGAAMMAGYSNSILNGESPGTANDLLSFAVTVANIIPPHFTLEMNGRYTGEATVTTASITPIGQVTGQPAGLQTWESLNLTITDKNVIVANGWGAGGSDHVTKQTKGLTPTSMLSNPVIDALRWVLVVFTPELAPTVLELGKVAVDEVPPDRISNP
jgi:hypothetical protein